MCVSDSLIGIDRFVLPFSAAPYLIILTYWLGQWGLDDPQRFFLDEAKVALSAGTEFGAAYQQFVRLNFGCPRSTLEEGLARMERSLRGTTKP